MTIYIGNLCSRRSRSICSISSVSTERSRTAACHWIEYSTQARFCVCRDAVVNDADEQKAIDDLQDVEDGSDDPGQQGHAT